MIGVNDLSNYVKYKTHTNCCADDLRSMKAKTETSKSVATVSPSLLPYFPWQRPLSLSSPWLEELQHLVEVLFLAAYFYHNRGSRTDVPRCRRSFCHCNKKTREKRKRKKMGIWVSIASTFFLIHIAPCFSHALTCTPSTRF